MAPPDRIEELLQQPNVTDRDRLVISARVAVDAAVTLIQATDARAQPSKRLFRAVQVDVPQPDRQMRGVGPRALGDRARLKTRELPMMAMRIMNGQRRSLVWLFFRIELQLCGYVNSAVDRPVHWALHLEDIVRPLCRLHLVFGHAFQREDDVDPT